MVKTSLYTSYLWL